MKNKLEKPQTLGRGVSLTLEMSEAVNRRIAELGPFVNGFSAYVQRLIYVDLAKEILKPEIPLKKNGERPFNSELSSQALATA